ncbi:UvrD-helicase domain-containing protein [Methanobacterium paludis]|nr:UvrD-helicase domain-containing protein [Methanobacterium paludis]
MTFVDLSRTYTSEDELNELEYELNPAKTALISFLEKNLPGKWKIFIEPYLNGSYPDLILLNPDSGIMIYKIMDTSSNSTPEMDKKQLDYYRNKIIQELVPDMAEKMDINSKIFVVIQTGVYIHDLSGSQVRERYSDYPYLTACGYDDLEEYNLTNVVPGAEFSRSKFMERKWAGELESWLKPSYHHDKRTELKLTGEQKIRAKPQPGHRRLRGSAGSGKTLVIAYRAAQLASEGHKVLVITYNRTLWYYIKDFVDNTPYNFDWANITFRHFHGFCRDILNELMVPMGDIEDVPFLVEESINGVDIEKFKFDSILIDEGQDYEWDWYNLLSQFLNERDELFFVCDKKQNVYERELNWIDNMGKFEGKVKFKGKWPELNTVYRLPKKIADFSNKFSEEYGLDQSVHMDYSQATLLKDSTLFQWKNIQTADWLSEVKEAYEVIKKQGVVDNSQIVILIPKNSMGVELVEFFTEQQVDVDHVFVVDGKRDWRNKKTFISGNGRLRISTIHKFKGWEANNVIMLIPPKWSVDENLDSIVYTAMTRTLKDLIVLNSNERYWDFGKEYEED